MLPRPIEMIAQLVEKPSVSAALPELDQSNRQVVELLAGWLEPLGFAIHIQPLPDNPEKANLIATLGAGEGGLVIAGHTDTVPCNEHLWASDPFTLTERNGALYGLGTTDMKGFLALVVEAARDFRANTLTRPLTFLATADEETTMAGARALHAEGLPAPRHAVIGEPTSMRPVQVHKGMLMEAIRLTGRSGHSSDPDMGINALDGMYRVLAALMAWRETLAEQHKDPRFKVPVPTLNLGHIHGGDSPNRICGACELHVDLRILPSMSLSSLRDELHERVTKAILGSGLEVNFEALFDGIPALETGDQAEILKAACALTGASPGAVTFGTEGPYLTALGMETVILGPGDLAVAHQPDECLSIDRIDPTVMLLRDLIQRFCANPD
ncbi:MAG: acetylornithine deacetylase [Leptospirillia bacterium]